MAYANNWFELGGGRIDPVDGSALTGGLAVGKYLAAYVMEKALSVDNLFVIATVFAMFKVPKEYRHRVLFWGIIGAIVMRGIMIGAGTELVARFDWLMYVFGAFLIYTGITMLRTHEDGSDAPGAEFIQKTIRRFVPVSDKIDSRNFFFRKEGVLFATTALSLVLVVVGAKMLFGEWLKPLLGKELFIWGSLGLVGLMIAGGIVASVLSKPPEKK